MPNNAISNLPPPMNHVFVDFENVHQVDLSIIGMKGFTFTLLLGARQTKLDVAMVEKLIEHAASVQLVRLSSSGKNALDFALAYYVGRAAMTDPTACFHIVSRDTGFDPLIEHLRSRRIHARRHDDFTALPCSGLAKAPSVPPEDQLNRVVEHLRKHTTARPKRKKTLESHLRPFCGKTATESDASNLIERLQQAGLITIGDKDAITYHL